MDELLSRPWVGASWEGFVVGQILDCLSTWGIAAEPCFFRTSDGHEVDLVLQLQRERWAIEIKLSASPGPGDLERLSKAAEMVGADRRVLLSRTARTVEAKDSVSTNLPGLLKLLQPKRRS